MSNDDPPVGMIDPAIFDEADDNIVQPFQLESSALRGRCVRLGSVLDEVLSAHDYPAPVAHLVAETMALTTLLSSMLKYEGVFTLQTKGDGPLGMLVSDMMSNGNVRACASFDAERLSHAREPLSALKTVEGSQNHLAQYLGKGYIAFTVDQGAETERYQGIVELQGASLVDCVQHYFLQSEQIKTGIKMAAGLRDGKWRAGGVMVQMMPEEGGYAALGNVDEDDWRRAMVLLDSCTDDELLDPDLHSNVLLRRLYHEEGVRVFDPLPLRHACRCSQDKVEQVVANFGAVDVIPKI
ncbi:MAG: Hsp33 family molecular chaperone HslO, partial [Bdellovibrionales bacterium]